MTINIEFFLARHPSFLLGREGCVKCFHCGRVLAAICSSTGNIHPFFALKRSGDKLTNK
jgi:hypothetical protein